MKPASKKYPRRNRNRIRKITRLLLPLSLIISVISICLIVFLVKIIRKPILISPIIATFVGDSVDDDNALMELEKILRDRKISYTSINKASNSLIINLTNSRQVIISPRKELDGEISSLQYLLSHLTMEGKDFTRLDLRFDKPVIVLR